MSRNLYVYGLGGIVAPFVGIKIIDLLIQFLPGCDMNLSNVIRQHWAALRALVLTVIVGIRLPLVHLVGGTFRASSDKTDGSIIDPPASCSQPIDRLQVTGRQGQRAPPVSQQAVGRRCQDTTDGQWWRVEPRPESVVEAHSSDPRTSAGGNGYAANLRRRCTATSVTPTVSTAAAVLHLGGVGAVLAVIWARRTQGNCGHSDARVISVNEPPTTTPSPSSPPTKV